MARTQSVDAHNRVLEAALELFVERGIEPTSMDALAAASGVSKATIYKHWPGGKESLLMELLLTVSGAATEVEEQDTGDLYTDLARVLTDKPRNDRPEEKNRLMPQMIAYSATHQKFGAAWRSRVMEVPKRRLKRILDQATKDGRVSGKLEMNTCYALLLGPLLFIHILGAEAEQMNLGKASAETFCRAYELTNKPKTSRKK
jgi:AcrR family transcriptional regulator